MKTQVEIRVSASTPCNNLAGSIVAAYAEGKEILMTAIGPMPVNSAVKAVCVANRSLASKGVVLAIVPGLITRPIVDRRSGAEKPEEKPWVVTTLRLRNILEGSLTREEAQAIVKASAESHRPPEEPR